MTRPVSGYQNEPYMKTVIIAFFLFQIVSCTKVQECPNIPIQGKPSGHLISDKELVTVISLFKSNNLEFNSLQFYKYGKDESGSSYVCCYQFINNLKVFTDDIVFHFSPDGYKYDPTGTIIEAIQVDKIPVLDLPEVKSIFIKCIKNDDAYSGNKEKITSGCLNCELGYYDLNTGISYSVPDFRLAWRVSSDPGTVPYAYIDDKAKTLIIYDDGIRY
jgi:hypothetical protein